MGKQFKGITLPKDTAKDEEWKSVAKYTVDADGTTHKDVTIEAPVMGMKVK